MKALTREAVQAILPVLRKDTKARRALAPFAEGKGLPSEAAIEVRKWAARLYDEGSLNLNQRDRVKVMEFLATYGRPGNAAKTGEARTVQMNVLFTPSEKMLLDRVGEKTGFPPATYVHRAAVRAMMQDLGIEDGVQEQ